MIASHLRIIATLAAIVPLVSAASAPAESQLPRWSHPWARFQPGAWKHLRTTTETFSGDGKRSLTSTETSTFLDRVERNSFTLVQEGMIEVAGKKIRTRPNVIQRGFNGEDQGDSATVRGGDRAIVRIDEQQIPVDIYEVEIDSDTERQNSKFYIARDRAPYLLKKVSVSTDQSGEKKLYQTTEEVIAVDMPERVLTRTLPTSHIKTVRTSPRGTTVTLSVHCEHVPGGLISETTKELDAEGQLVRRSTVELVDYGFSTRPKGGLIQRLIERRLMRKSR